MSTIETGVATSGEGTSGEGTSVEGTSVEGTSEVSGVEPKSNDKISTIGAGAQTLSEILLLLDDTTATSQLYRKQLIYRLLLTTMKCKESFIEIFLSLCKDGVRDNIRSQLNKYLIGLIVDTDGLNNFDITLLKKYNDDHLTSQHHY